MTDEQIALARRAVACKGWRWVPGMKYIHRHDIGPDVWYPRIGRHGEKPVRAKIRKDVLPMFDDPATMGCLLALVREALDSPRAHVLYVAGLHRWECADNRVVLGVGATEAEALVAALEEAP